MNILKKTGVFAVSFIISLALFTGTAFAATYKVVKNDTLYSIGNLFDTSATALRSDNQLSSNTIYVGQKLTVPAKVYTVKSGDSLYKIAKKYNVTLASLRKANNIWTDNIVPGKKLLLPGVKASSSSGSTASKKAVISYTSDELDLLARLITAETTGEPYNAMVGVGAVVVNRVQSSDWPNTISSVINQKINGYYQFTPVKNGFIKNAASKDALKAAQEALSGTDPSKGAQFYYDDSSTSQWMLSQPVTTKIGHMVFAK